MSPLRRWLAIVCAVSAAAAFAVAVQGSAWWRVGDEVGIGTVSSRHCFGGGACQRTGLGWAGGTDTWVRAGSATYAAGLVAALMLLALAGALAARARGRLLAASAGVATLTAAVVGTVFVVNRPTTVAGTEADYGQLLFALAIALAAGVVGTTLWQTRAGAGSAPR